MISKEDAVLLAIYNLSGASTMVAVDNDAVLEEANRLLSMSPQQLEEYKRKAVSRKNN